MLEKLLTQHTTHSGRWEQLPSHGIPGWRLGTITGVGNKVVLFGGRDNNKPTAENYHLRVFDTVAKTWETRAPEEGNPTPGPRCRHSAYPYKNGILVYGGAVGDEYSGELWYYDIDTNLWEFIVEGTKLLGVAMTMLDGELIIAGGMGGFASEKNVYRVDLELKSIFLHSVLPVGGQEGSLVNIDNELYAYGMFNGPNQAYVMKFDKGAKYWFEYDQRYPLRNGTMGVEAFGYGYFCGGFSIPSLPQSERFIRYKPSIGQWVGIGDPFLMATGSNVAIAFSNGGLYFAKTGFSLMGEFAVYIPTSH